MASATPRVEVAVEPGAPRSAIALEMHGLHGRVLCSVTRSPVPAEVAWAGRACRTSERDGGFRIPPTADPIEELEISAPGFESLVVRPDGSSDLGDLLLKPTGSGRVRVVDGDLVPAVGAEVLLADAYGGTQAPRRLGKTGAAGTLDVPLARSATVFARARKGELSTPALLFPGSEATLVVDGAGTEIEVRLSDGSPAAQVELRFSRRGDGVPLQCTSTTDTDGRVPERLPPGGYMVEAPAPDVSILNITGGSQGVSAIGATWGLRASGGSITVTVQVALPGGLEIVDASTKTPIEEATVWLQVDHGQGWESLKGGKPLRATNGLFRLPFTPEALEDPEARFAVGVFAPGYLRRSCGLPTASEPIVRVELERVAETRHATVLSSSGLAFPHELHCYSMQDGLLLWRGFLDSDGRLPVPLGSEDLLLRAGPFDSAFSVEVACEPDEPCIIELPTGRVRVTGAIDASRLILIGEGGSLFEGVLLDGALLFDSIPVGDYAVVSEQEVGAFLLERSRGAELPVAVERGRETRVERGAPGPGPSTGRIVARGIPAQDTFVLPLFGSPDSPAAIRAGARRYPVDSSGEFRLDPTDARATRILVCTSGLDGQDAMVGIGRLAEPIEVCAGFLRLDVQNLSGVGRFTALWQPRLPGSTVGVHSAEGIVGTQLRIGPLPCGQQSVQVVGGHMMRVLSFLVKEGEDTVLVVNTEKE